MRMKKQVSFSSRVSQILGVIGLVFCLATLAMSGDTAGLAKRAVHLEAMDVKYQPFARTLQDVARGFEDQKILSLIRKYTERSHEDA